MELPADLPDAVFEALANTRISGKLIDLQLDDGPPIKRTREDRKPYAKRSDAKKPYVKKPYVKKPHDTKAPGKSPDAGQSTRKPRHK